MDYNVMKLHAIDAFRTYKNDDTKYKTAMTDFYAKGKENPSVSKIILDDTITNGQKAASIVSNEVMKNAKTPVILPVSSHFNQMAEFEARANMALMAIKRGIDASEIPEDKNLEKLSEKQEFNQRFNELYPKTAQKRERIIDAHRIKMNEVTPKANWSEKIMYAKTNAEYRELYPKSFMTRVSLIIKNQIRDNEVTKRVNGFFNRLSYLPTVDRSFHFMKQVKK